MRFKFFLFSLFVAIATCAQNQRGLVRTIGTSSHHGVPVAGATIKVKGNSQQYLSDNKGAFSLSMHSANAGDKFQLLNVTKRGYELADKDFLSKTFAYSSQSLLEIVLLSTEEMEKEKQAIEDRVFKIAKDNYEKKRDGLKLEQEQGLITIEDYRAKLKTLQDQYDTFDEILSAMAEHYARTDYDRLDSLDVLINTHIINGELDEADMLVAQKGNLDDRIAAYQRHAATNAAAREMLDKLTDELRDQRLAYEKERDDIANDLYNKHSIAISRFDFDQALEMLKLRADLDTTNVDVMSDYAELCFKQGRFEDCERYFMTCAHIASLCHDLASESKIYNNLGLLSSTIHDYGKSEKFYKSALECMDRLFSDYPEEYRADFATLQDNIAGFYTDIQEYETSEKMYLLAKENRELLFKQNPETYGNDLATTQNNLGSLYRNLRDYARSKKFYELALETISQLFEKTPDIYRAALATIQNSLGELYLNLHDSANSEKYLKLALDNKEQLFNQNPEAYRADLAMTQNNLGNLYSYIHDYANSENFLLSALENYEQLFRQNTNAYRIYIAVLQDNLGCVYRETNDFYNSEKFSLLSLNNFEQLFEEYPTVYQTDLAQVQDNLGQLYLKFQKYTKSEEYFRESLKIREKLYNMNPDAYMEVLAITYYNVMLLYEQIEDFHKYETYLNKALDLHVKLYDLQPDLYGSYLLHLRNRMTGLMLMKNENIDKIFLYAQDTYKMDQTDGDSKYFLIEILNIKAHELSDIEQYSKALEKINYAIELSPLQAELFNTKGEIFLIQGRNDEALEMWKKVLELNPNFLDDYPDGTELSNGLKKLGVIN